MEGPYVATSNFEKSFTDHNIDTHTLTSFSTFIMKLFLVFAVVATVVDSVPQPTVSRLAQVATPVRPSVRNGRQIELDFGWVLL